MAVAGLAVALAAANRAGLSAADPQLKSASAMFPPALTDRTRQNAQKYPWAKQACERIVADAAPWRKLSDDELWDLMFSSSIKRSWMVWSNGHCPACQQPVPMDEWIPAALEQPWKMQCPQCRQRFPKNDFANVSTWHDACVEVHDLAMAYDAVFAGISRDASLITFLAAQAQRHQLDNPKASFLDIQRNIEQRIFRDTLANRRKIESNYPSTDISILTIQTVLGSPDNREQVTAGLDRVIQQATAVDGLSGEKGNLRGFQEAKEGVADVLRWDTQSRWLAGGEVTANRAGHARGCVRVRRSTRRPSTIAT